jgi:predicted amidohydrolase YtcJ
MRNFLPFRTLLDQGVVVAGGSDHMVRFDSREAITRRTADGGVLHPEQAVRRAEALRMWNPVELT